ncbi:hypothetical protein [Limosilactobacillus antri]|uniref:hypothetical protein n=1 Tax=Limosilactobacillus antri TaxID=227943 RepID=UPI001F576897|nr:hypothetical protein [Limosilactobacillus antri]
MKINEFMNKLDDLVILIRPSDYIFVYANEWQSKHNNPFLILNPKKEGLFEFEDWSECRRLPFDRLRGVLNLVGEFRGTPVDERFPEKKYRLRWIDDKDEDCNYLYKHGNWWSITSNELAPAFTEKELQRLKINNPKFAPAIDAMKEEVKDD